jgi:hypothetical protein
MSDILIALGSGCHRDSRQGSLVIAGASHVGLVAEGYETLDVPTIGSAPLVVVSDLGERAPQ